MQDSNITITVKAVGAEEAGAKLNKLGATMTKMTVNQNGTVVASGKLTSTLEKQSKATDRAGDSTHRAGESQKRYFSHIAKTTIQSALINKLFLEFVDVAGQAIQQVDLMNNFPQTMASMGQSTKDAGEAFQSLRDYVGATGANLGQAVSMVTRFTGVTNDVKAATAIYQGLNNALIAGDTTLEEQKNAAIQFGQALERGKPDMREWTTLSTVMSQQLGLVAKQMGYVNTSALGQALRDGEESMATFTTELTKLSTTGVIAEQARARMSGIQFSFGVMKNTLIQGVAQIVNAFGRQNIVLVFTSITAAIKVLVTWVINLINALITLFNFFSRLVGGVQLKKVTGDTAQIADNLNSGAGGAGDLGKGLKGASKEAEKINKSLASFDKMNVLADKTGGGKDDDDDSGGGSKFDAGQLAELADLGNPFADMTKGLEKASYWANILAGVFAALAGNALINKIFGVNVLKEFAKGMGKYVLLPLAKSFPGAVTTAVKTVGTFGAALGRGLFGAGSGGSGVLGTAAQYGAKIGLAVRGGLMSAFSGIGRIFLAVGTVLLDALWTYVLFPLAGAVGTLAGILGLPIWATVAIIVAVVAIIIGIIALIWKNWETIWGWIVTAYQASWDFIVGLWQKLYDIFAGPVKWIWQFIEGVFIAIVAIIAIALELIFKLWLWAWTKIFEFMIGVAGWINENVVQPIWQFFQNLWDTITQAVVKAWQNIFDNVLRPIGSWVNENVIKPVMNFFKSLWDTVTGYINGFVNKAREILGALWGWIRDNVVNPIANLFSSMWDNVKLGLSRMIDGLRSIFSGITEIFKTPLNGIIDLINKAIDGVNKLKVPDWVPSLGGKSPGIPRLPRLARGGVVERATLAMIGESGKEAIVPLENNMEWIDKLAAKINTATAGGNGQPVQLVVQIGEEKIVTKVIDLINEKTQMGGRNTILV